MKFTSLKDMAKGISEAPGWDRKKLAKHLGVDYVTVCRWTSGAVTTTNHDNMEELMRLYMEICKNSADEWGEESGDYKHQDYYIPEGSSATIYHTGNITIINHGILRIVSAEEDKKQDN